MPRFVQHALNADQARTRDSFGDEWTRLYPEHGHTTPEWQAERDIFSSTPGTVPSDFKGKLVLDGGCGNGRYAKLANDWGAGGCVDISSAVEIASRNVADRPGVDVVQAELFELPFRPATFDMAYSVGVSPHARRQARIPGDSAIGEIGRNLFDLCSRTGQSGALRD